jgi:hypothetical protein
MKNKLIDNIRFYKFILPMALLLEGSMGFAMQEGEVNDRIESEDEMGEIRNFHEQTSLSPLFEQVGTWIRQDKIPANKILVISDVDGVLTNWSNPLEMEKMHEVIHEREGSSEIIRNLIGLGVNVVISSAWKNFGETINRLEQVGLYNRLKDKTAWDGIQHYKSHTFSDIYGEKRMISLQYYQDGRIVSVRRQGFDPECYPNKALSGYVVDSDLCQQIQKVVFADDKKRNIWTFKNDLQNHNLYPNAQAYYYEFTLISGTS